MEWLVSPLNPFNQICCVFLDSCVRLLYGCYQKSEVHLSRLNFLQGWRFCFGADHWLKTGCKQSWWLAKQTDSRIKINARAAQFLQISSAFYNIWTMLRDATGESWHLIERHYVERHLFEPILKILQHAPLLATLQKWERCLPRRSAVSPFSLAHEQGN